MLKKEYFMETLYRRLEEYHSQDIYPFHMPGHKRNERVVDFLPGLTKDITEIEGFDDLHHPTGILWEAQKTAAKIYGADETFYSVNGSTGALLAAVCACTTPGGAVLMARNCHRSVYHGICLMQLDSHYLYPEITIPYGLNGSIQPVQVADALSAHPDVQTVVITSPTYDGVVSPIKEIAKIVHHHGLPLIVDEAHGAHFPFHSYFPASALGEGADVVVHSMHKTLPALTQTALLHVNGTLVNRERIRRYMAMFQTSSPSYLLMGSMDACLRQLSRSGFLLFEKYVERLKRSRERLSKLHFIRLAGEDLIDRKTVWDLDRSKLILDVQDSCMDGHRLYEYLWKKCSLQMEMETQTYVLGMTSMADTEEGFERLCQALEELEKSWIGEGQIPHREQTIYSQDSSFFPGEKILPIGKAMERSCVKRPIGQSEGCVSGGFLYMYPPGIPLVVPGEKITSDLIEKITRLQDIGLTVQGLTGISGSEIPVIFTRGCEGTDSYDDILL